MKAEELKSKIEFKTVEVGRGRMMITGILQVQATMEYSISEAKRYPQLLDHVKENIRERIMRQLYDDQREELYAALHSLFMASPMDFEALNSARDRILTAALRQGPREPSPQQAQAGLTP